MIIHESIEIIDKNMFFSPSSFNNKLHDFLHNIILIHRLDIFPYSHNQKR